ncbi:bifunctional non-homologous end joining protein LigD [Marininema mesophilum]|uniref:Bifunctional non-homologous end joining protein LigD n=1 Tax=Marininema mesophilum TaxID=1048340 RepID=A0A1H2XWW0_9BACL|nr:non-homologous end-joining DNA ligase [Marininema mesophilum]SDW97346.1 bifunctional non-homologous end joining protein LigD [Marininema mesophilum]
MGKVSKASTVQIEEREIRISNPDKVLFPDISLTKWDWILHLTRLAPYILPYARRRFLTMIRWPHGVGGESFYQKNAPSHIPDWISTASSGKLNYILLENAPTLVWLANLACLEYHLSFDRADDPGMPTELVFDIDPSVEDFDRVIETALLTREALRELDLDGVVKTSGATGLQVYVPIQPIYPFEQTRRISHFLADYLAGRRPDLITLERKVDKRGEKVYFDYLQHWRGKSLIAPYSTRARPGAPVSTPLTWDELKPGLTPQAFTVNTIHKRLSLKGDPFQKVVQPASPYRLDPILAFLNRKKR